VSKSGEFSMFRGLNLINVDLKGRFAMPGRYREILQELCEGKLIATIDTEQKCLLIYPEPAWLEIEKKLALLPSFDLQARRIQRLLIGHATEMGWDSAGRLLLPPPLREYADLQKEIALVGQGNKFEVWNEAHWKTARDTWLQEPLAKDDSLSTALRDLSL
jgi:MraZ protein